MRRPLLIVCLLFPACAEFPQIDARIPEAERVGAPPTLVPLGPILAQADAPAAVDPAPAVEPRLAGLAARAAALRGPVLTPAEADRLAEDVDP